MWYNEQIGRIDSKAALAFGFTSHATREDAMTKTCFQTLLYLLVATALSLGEVPPDKRPSASGSDAVDAFDEAMAAQPKLLHISARVDGSGRMVFNSKSVRYEHKHWRQPNHVLFDGEPWIKLDRTPVPWRDFGDRLDLSKARIVKRSGRDMIAIEHTPDGFDLYLCDSPNGGSDYSVTLAIPRRK